MNHNIKIRYEGYLIVTPTGRDIVTHWLRTTALDGSPWREKARGSGVTKRAQPEVGHKEQLPHVQHGLTIQSLRGQLVIQLSAGKLVGM